MEQIDLIPMALISAVFAISFGYLLVEFVRARKVKN